MAVDSCHDALRPNVHDRLDPGQTAGTTLDDRSNGCDRQFGKYSVVGNVIQSGATEKLAAALPDNGRYRRFTDRPCLWRGAKDEFDLERNEFVIHPTFDLLSQYFRV